MTPASLNLTTYHTNVVEQIAERFEATVNVVAAYARFTDTIPERAITIEFDGITPENPDDAGTEQFHADVRFVAHVFVSFLIDNPELEVRRIAADLVAWTYGRRFDCPVGPAKIISAQPDAIELPGRSGRAGEGEDYEVWRIEWSHEAFLGESVWGATGTEPVEVWTDNQGETTNLLA